METSFNEEYFMDSKFSNYKNYDERPYNQLAKDIVKVLGLNRKDKIFDFGCATGKLVQHLYDLGNRNVSGFDISEWAINHGKEIYPEIADKISITELTKEPKVITCLDVLEHLETDDLYKTLDKLRSLKSKYLVVRTPVCSKMGQEYVLDCSRKDSTHVQTMTKQMWYQLLNSFDFKLMGTINETDIYDSEGVLCAVFENQTCDEVYFRDRGLELKHGMMVKQWNEFFKPKSVCDLGCGRGPFMYYWEMICDVEGHEYSEYAALNKLCKSSIYPINLSNDNMFVPKFNLSTAIDVLEHMEYNNLDIAINNIISSSLKYILISVPFKGNPDLDADPTHIIKEDKMWWINKFLDKGLKEVEVPDHFLYKEQLLIFEK